MMGKSCAEKSRWGECGQKPNPNTDSRPPPSPKWTIKISRELRYAGADVTSGLLEQADEAEKFMFVTS
jgi:hypothetical protein